MIVELNGTPGRSDVDDIFRWLKYPDGSIKMNELQRTRAPSTGSWFLDGEAFASVKRGRIQVLWLHGSGMNTTSDAVDVLTFISGFGEEHHLVSSLKVSRSPGEY